MLYVSDHNWKKNQQCPVLDGRQTSADRVWQAVAAWKVTLLWDAPYCPSCPIPTRQVSPHATILWRPDAGRFNAYLLRPAQPNATVNDDPAIEMSAIASTEGEHSQHKAFELLSTTSQDDSSFFEVFCPALVSVQPDPRCIRLRSHSRCNSLTVTTVASGNQALCQAGSCWSCPECAPDPPLARSCLQSEFVDCGHMHLHLHILCATPGVCTWHVVTT